jgi:murein DD-endopeptidase MepM/ murein hydrolase activator NlpD
MPLLSKKKLLGNFLLLMLIAGLLMPQEFTNPVSGADRNSYNVKSFWYYPWGKSGTHKGVDIFAKQGTEVNASTYGLVIYTGEITIGGKIVLILGPKWRLHYYAHLHDIHTTAFSIVGTNKKIGTVGTTGNAKGKMPHLHYSIMTLIPYPWKMDWERQGWKKMFYLNPIEYL